MLGILKDHVNRLVFQHDFFQSRQVDMAQLSVELCRETSASQRSRADLIRRIPDHDLAARALADASVRDDLAFLVWLELLDGYDFAFAFYAGRCVLVLDFGLVDSTVGSRREEALHSREINGHTPELRAG